MNTIGIEMTPAEKAAQRLRSRSMKQLLSEFVLTGILYDADPVLYKDIPTVRGWYMDELKRRDPVAYDDWVLLSGEDQDLYEFFNT